MNLQPSGYEPDELPIAPPRDVISKNLKFLVLVQGYSPRDSTPRCILDNKYNTFNQTCQNIKKGEISTNSRHFDTFLEDSELLSDLSVSE